MKTEVKIIIGDITKIKVDAIVNAANRTLLGGGGVDGMIHLNAGPELLEECKTLGGCEKGEAKITKGYDLLAKHIIHTVGPVFGLERGKEKELLRNCYWNSLELAKQYNLESIAFPAISTGIYHFPKDEATKIAIDTVNDFIDKNPNSFKKIIFVLFDQGGFSIYEDVKNGYLSKRK
jgi:O-acetyl-ADP-ribose deacetylase